MRVGFKAGYNLMMIDADIILKEQKRRVVEEEVDRALLSISLIFSLNKIKIFKERKRRVVEEEVDQALGIRRGRNKENR